jgi:hypothetical protein
VVVSLYVVLCETAAAERESHWRDCPPDGEGVVPVHRGGGTRTASRTPRRHTQKPSPSVRGTERPLERQRRRAAQARAAPGGTPTRIPGLLATDSLIAWPLTAAYRVGGAGCHARTRSATIETGGSTTAGAAVATSSRGSSGSSGSGGSGGSSRVKEAEAVAGRHTLGFRPRFEVGAVIVVSDHWVLRVSCRPRKGREHGSRQAALRLGREESIRTPGGRQEPGRGICAFQHRNAHV